jgi:hypothetical protein
MSLSGPINKRECHPQGLQVLYPLTISHFHMFHSKALFFFLIMHIRLNNARKMYISSSTTGFHSFTFHLLQHKFPLEFLYY